MRETLRKEAPPSGFLTGTIAFLDGIDSAEKRWYNHLNKLAFYRGIERMEEKQRPSISEIKTILAQFEI